MKSTLTKTLLVLSFLGTVPFLTTASEQSSGFKQVVANSVLANETRINSKLTSSNLQMLVERAQQYRKDCARLASLKLPANKNDKTGLDMNIPVREKYVGICIKKALKNDKELAVLLANHNEQ